MSQTSESSAKKLKALELYSETCNVQQACDGAGIHFTTWYKWKREDEDFAEAVEKSKECVADKLEAEAVKRAINKSDLLIIFLLKGLKPHTYHDRVSTEVTTKSASTGDPGRSKLTDKDIDALIDQAQDLKRSRKASKPVPGAIIQQSEASNNDASVQ
jgi:hypothetical protein